MIEDKIIKITKESHYLIESIDFFSQNLSFEQITSYGYYFVHDMLMLESSGIFVLEENQFILKANVASDFAITSFDNTPLLKTIATKFGRAMQKELKSYFDEKFIDDEHITMAMPIIVKDQTLAFIVSKKKYLDLSDSGLATIFNAINQLINKASESAKNFEQFKDASTALDRKIFNLLFINHSTKALMSEIDLEPLYTLCIDVIRELTASSVTSFALYDQAKKSLVMKGYKDILSFDDYYCELKLIDESFKPTKHVYHTESDYDALSKIFSNPEVFLNLKANYVVLLVKDKVLGFVTLGERVSNKVYTEELLGQVESLISSIYIAIKNASFITTIKRQKIEIEDQLERLNQLNAAIKNINTCESVDELSHIVAQTLTFGFGIKKVLIALKDEEGYIIKAYNGFETKSNHLIVSEAFKATFFDQTYFEPIERELNTYIDEGLLKEIGERNCFVSVPLITTESDIHQDPLGFVMVFETEAPLRKSHIITLETLSNSIAPIINHIQEKEYIINNYRPNTEALLMNKIKEALEYRSTYYIDFKIYYKKMDKKPFETLDISLYEHLNTYLVDNILYHIAYDPLEDDHIFDGYLEIEDERDFVDSMKTRV
jgi:transcriptional regulator with GAF, ATPase, and Fis domain